MKFSVTMQIRKIMQIDFSHTYSFLFSFHATHCSLLLPGFIIMEFLLLFVILCHVLLGVNSDPALTQTESQLLIKPNGSFKLTCRGSGYDFGSYGMNWIRQAQGKGLEWLGYIWYDASKTVYEKSVEGRLVITRNNADSVTFMELKNLIPDDTAVYYCARAQWHKSPQLCTISCNWWCAKRVWKASRILVQGKKKKTN
uniref:Ig-like domain-containing protein n=1 Tax=Leptobrachium leishanense TaxID=445787 RepID=A0A8C5M861_9ANUR